MISIKDLNKIVKARLKDAKELIKSKRYDGSVYLCGYAVEIALKAKICNLLDWDGYPSSRNEFKYFESFRTHNLDVLIKLSGSESLIKSSHMKDWSIIALWDPEVRYKPIGSAKEKDAKNMLLSANKIIKIL